MVRHLLAAFLLTFAGPALAQQCPQPQGWSKPERHAAARLPRFRFALKPDTTAQLDLLVQRSVVLATKEGKEGWMDRFAGLAAIDVEKAGKLEVLLSDRAYIDLVRDGTTLQSVDHRRVNCNGIYKSVSFDVLPGRYALQITGSGARSIRVATLFH